MGGANTLRASVEVATALAAARASAHLCAMPVSALYHPDPRFVRLGPDFSDAVEPAAFPRRAERWFNDRWARRVGLEGLKTGEREAAFARFEPLPGQPGPAAMRYHGHQFGQYNPDLGDGRGFLFAQLRDTDSGRLLDLATKGSGATPWSRAGDGRLTLKGGVREVMAAEMLEALGVPTSKAFALYETGEALVRGDEPSPTRSAVLTRLSWSHVRFGTFQRAAYLDRADWVRTLVDHVVEAYAPELGALEDDDRVAGVLARAVRLSAELTASWMAAGFVHGVLNTDNMNINGESFDYGPYRFLPVSDPGFTAAYFDHGGRYAFGRQPQAVFWNLQQLAASLVPAMRDPAPLVVALNRFGDLYAAGLSGAVVRRLGLEPGEDDAELTRATFALLAEGGAALRWEPLFFDWFGGEASERRALAGPRAALYVGEAAASFRARLKGRAASPGLDLARPYFARNEPEELLYDEIEALWSAISSREDWTPFERKLASIGEARDAYGFASAQDAAVRRSQA